MSVPDGQPRLVVVTGAASGIGFATVEALRRCEVSVIGVDITPRPTALLADDRVVWVSGDTSEARTWDDVNAVAVDLDRSGADGLVACAGDVVVSPFLDTEIDEWRRLFEVNALSVVQALRALLPPMIARGHGAVAAVCSVNSLFAEDQLSAYSTSKAALLHVVRSAALEHSRHGVRINAVLPGAVDTPMLHRHLATTDDPQGGRRAIERRTPTGRIVRPSEVADVVCFLLSARSNGMSGSTVVVDGGLTSAYDFDPGVDQ